MSCTNCKIQSQHLKDKCPYAQCWRCGAEGHRYSKYCPQYGKKEGEVDGSEGSKDDSQKPKLTRRQSSYIFIAYTIARFTNLGPSSPGPSTSKWGQSITFCTFILYHGQNQSCFKSVKAQPQSLFHSSNITKYCCGIPMYFASMHVLNTWIKILVKSKLLQSCLIHFHIGTYEEITQAICIFQNDSKQWIWHHIGKSWKLALRFKHSDQALRRSLSLRSQ